MGLSQKALAEFIGTTQNTISRWENGTMGIDEPRGLWLSRKLDALERSGVGRRAAG